ncbi:hypothetical protein CDL12_23961 [Handroanthus impetiginosus]|uniref:Surfeit locus protein 2 n=1 Tax=Handroanthus impetiginosus TaxID=429701 RepID=A0A2G9GE02_9LAMI|nr:hypothetical protein CDL12_23961 [Handroanthus impetiginosus]
MGKKKKGDENTKPSEQKEGHNLLGAPKFKQLENGRFRCIQTGHELPAQARDAYAESKHCRLGLIDYALARNKPPLNMFEQDPASRSKLICKLTGVTINKSEEHIWKHINGKRFLNMLDKQEADKEMQNGTTEKQDEEKEEKKKNEDGDLKKKQKKKKKKKKKDKKNINQEKEHVDEIINGVRDKTSKSSDSEDEADFWKPPVGERWDHDDGGDRWGSDSESGPESDGAVEEGMSDGVEEVMSDGDDEEDMEAEEAKDEAGDPSKKTKRMSLEIGPSSFESRKKKKKKTGVA